MFKQENKYLNRFIRRGFVFLQTILLCSCVGEVVSTQKDTTISEKRPNTTTGSFPGIHSVVPISNDKVEVYLFPAQGGSGNFSYQVLYDDQVVAGSAENLFRDYRGLFRVLISGLETGTHYTFTSQVYDIDKDATFKPANESIFETKTFSNEVTNFFGVSDVSNVSGIEGVDSINVRWIAASKDPTSPFGKPSDPRTHEFILLEADKQTPGSVNNAQLSESDGRIVRSLNWQPGLNNTVINGLKSDQEYYVFVRTLHKDSVDDPSNPRLRSELNNKYGIIRTLTSDASSIDFDDYFEVAPNEGNSGLNSLLTDWNPITGIFDHLRIYYAFSSQLPPSTSIDTSSCPNRFEVDFFNNEAACKKINDTTSTGTTINDLPALEDYELQLVICLDSTCSDKIVNPGMRCNFQSPADSCNARTQTELASFQGIQSITAAQDISQLGSFYLNYSAPDFSQGYFDGLVVEYTSDRASLDNWLANSTSPKPATQILNAADYSGNLVVENYDLEQDNQIEISNLPYDSSEYCFSLYPFLYNSDGDMDDSQAGSLKRVWSCEAAAPEGPIAEEFRGFDSGQTTSQTLSMNWQAPSSGVYSHYEIFYRKGNTLSDTSFSFDTAIQDTTVDFDNSEYQRILLTANMGNGEPRIQHEIGGLTDGMWVLGIRTYYLAGINNVVRSQETPQLLFCEVDSSDGTSITCTVTE